MYMSTYIYMYIYIYVYLYIYMCVCVTLYTMFIDICWLMIAKSSFCWVLRSCSVSHSGYSLVLLLKIPECFYLSDTILFFAGPHFWRHTQSGLFGGFCWCLWRVVLNTSDERWRKSGKWWPIWHCKIADRSENDKLWNIDWDFEKQMVACEFTH